MHESNTAIGILLIVVIFCGGMLYSGAHKNNMRQQNAETRIEQQVVRLRAHHTNQQIVCDSQFTESWENSGYGIVGRRCWVPENSRQVETICVPTGCWIKE